MTFNIFSNKGVVINDNDPLTVIEVNGDPIIGIDPVKMATSL